LINNKNILTINIVDCKVFPRSQQRRKAMNAPFKLAKSLRVLCDVLLGGGICGVAGYSLWLVWLLVSPSVIGRRPMISDSVTVALGEPGLPGVYRVTMASDNSKLAVSPRLFFTTGEIQFETNEWGIQLAVYLVKRILVSVLIVAFLYMIHHFLTDAMEGTPFTMDNARRLKWIGWMLLGISVVKPVWEDLFARWILSMIKVQNPMLSSWADAPFTFALIPLACFILILSAIFRRGVELEQEHAATV
jgi:hypothetical protein